MKTLPKDFKVQRQPALSGFAEQAKREYEKAVDPRGCVWFYQLESEDPGKTIYFHDPRDLHSQGFGGATLVFRISKTGEEYQAKGPWHSNSDALYSQTGVDLRDKHLTFVCVAEDRSWEGHQEVLTNILYLDEKPTLGLFERGKLLGQEIATKLQRPVAVYRESSGGSSSGWESPKDWTQEQISRWFKERTVKPSGSTT